MYPLHIFVLALFILFEFLKIALLFAGLPSSAEPFGPGKRPLEIVTNILLIQSFGLQDGNTWNAPSWSISVEFYANILFGAALVLLRNARTSTKVVASIVASLLCLGVVVLLSGDGINVTVDYGFFRCVYGFLIGYLCFVVHNRLSKRASVFFNEPLSVVVTVVFVINAGTGWLSFFAPLVFAYNVLSFTHEKGVISRMITTRPFLLLGEMSYSIYLTHWMVKSNFIERPIQILSRRLNTGVQDMDGETVIHFPNVFSGDVVVVIYLVAVLVFSFVTYKYVEVPGKRFVIGFMDRRFGLMSAARRAGMGEAGRP